MGSPGSWPQSLRATIKTLLGSRYPMILLWGPELIQIYNEAYIGLIGDKHPGALGRSIRDTQAESWEVIGPMIHAVMSTGVPNWVPAQMLPLERSGYREESYFSLSYSSVEDDDGRIKGMLCVCSEVTQQVLAERRTRLLRDLALGAGETRSVETTCRDLGAAMATHRLDLPFAVLYLRDEGKLKLARAVGLDSNIVDDVHAWPLLDARSGSVIIDDVERRFEVRAGPWDDPVRAALMMPIPSSEPGVAMGILVAAQSPNRALDEGYSSFFDLLAGQVSMALRNARAYEDQRKRSDALAELDRTKTAFFNNVSHEFRTPLTLMLGPLEDVLASKRLPADVATQLEVAHRNAVRLLRLVNTLLDFSRLEASRAEPSFESTDLATVTTDLASTFRSIIERAGLTLRVECTLSEPVFVDRDMWEKIVLNLLSNAFKFTFEGGVQVRLRAEDGRAKLEVEDTGTGIPASELPHLFERFHRVRGGRSRSYEGTGIGLALVHDLAKIHHGSVEVESTQGRGTLFTVTVPLGDAHLPKDLIHAPTLQRPVTLEAAAFVQEASRWSPEVAAVGGAQVQSATSKGRVLIVDDNTDMRDYVSRVLSPSFEVMTAEDGQAALELLESRTCDLVITDVMMPRLGGFGLLRALRDDARTRALPVIMLSARAGEEASIEGLESGADDYLVKPFSAAELVARARSTLHLARMRQQLAAQRAVASNLEQSVRARDEFLSLASHELKTPLTPLELQIGMVERRTAELTKDASAKEWLDKRMESLRRSSEKMHHLLDELIDLSQLVGDGLRLELETVDLLQVVRAIVDELKHAEVRIHSTCAAAVGWWDRERVRQMVAHLLANAVKFGAGKPIDVTVELEATTVRLTVEDYGIGISAAAQERIFDRFERAVSMRHFGGLGVGLYIVRRIVDALGGSVELHSIPGTGSTFTVVLPLDSRPK